VQRPVSIWSCLPLSVGWCAAGGRWWSYTIWWATSRSSSLIRQYSQIGNWTVWAGVGRLELLLLQHRCNGCVLKGAWEMISSQRSVEQLCDEQSEKVDNLLEDVCAADAELLSGNLWTKLTTSSTLMTENRTAVTARHHALVRTWVQHAPCRLSRQRSSSASRRSELGTQRCVHGRAACRQTPRVSMDNCARNQPCRPRKPCTCAGAVFCKHAATSTRLT